MKNQIQLPNPLKISPLLQKIQWVIDPVSFMENAAQQYPDIFTAEVIGFGETVVFVNHPQAIKEIFTNDRKKFLFVGKVNRIFEPLAGEYSLLMLNSERHKRRRKLTMPSFHGDRMRAYGSLISNLTEQVFSQLPLNQPFLARTAMQEISLQIILQAIFGLHKGARYDEIKR